MALGRGNAHAAALLLFVLIFQSCGLRHSAFAAIHTVGGSQRWDVGVDYTAWAAGQTFRVGDILFFPYSLAEHNVVVVNKAGYDACSGADPIATFNDGNTNVTLSTAGTHYYLCSVIGHCGAGMKLAVTVSAAAVAPTTPPTAAPTNPPTTPSPSTTPTPVPAPVPTPSAEAPASAPTPSSPAPVPSVGPPASSPAAPGSTPSSPGTPLPSPPPPNSAPSFLFSAAIAPLVALLVAFTLRH